MHYSFSIRGQGGCSVERERERERASERERGTEGEIGRIITSLLKHAEQDREKVSERGRERA